jgi:hypothetical membrane protein
MQEKKSKRFTNLQLCCIFSILCTIVFFVSIVLSISLTSNFNWTENYISNLAGFLGDRPIWTARGASSLIFNIGLILTGIFGIIFSFLIKKSRMFGGNLGRIGCSILTIDMISLSGIGVFPVTLGQIHVLFSFILFGLAPLLLLIMGYLIGKLFGKKWWWIICLISGVIFFFVSIFVCVPCFFGYSRAVSEVVVLSSILFLLILLGTKLITSKSINDSIRN